LRHAGKSVDKPSVKKIFCEAVFFCLIIHNTHLLGSF
jgi:hypothetical protein